MARKTAVVKFRGTGGSGPARRVRPRSPRSSLLWLREDAEHVAPQHAALPVRGPAAGGTARHTGWLAHLGEVASNALFVGDQRAQFHAAVAGGAFENIQREGAGEKLRPRPVAAGALGWLLLLRLLLLRVDEHRGRLGQEARSPHARRSENPCILDRVKSRWWHAG